jgi:Flp pilus assembly protein TadG
MSKKLLLRSVLRDQRGSVALFFGLTIFFLLATTGGAIDFGTAISKRFRLQAAADAAALAAARTDSDDAYELRRIGEDVFRLNYPDTTIMVFDVRVNQGNVVVTVTDKHPTTILQTVGLKEINFQAYAEVPRLTAGKAEIALVLDYSDSMLDNNKYTRLKEAADLLIDEITENGRNTNVKIGLVPFAAMVHADLPASYLRTDRPYDGCTQDRRAPYNTLEQVGNAGDASKWGEMTSTHACADMAAAGLKVLPLSSDVTEVKGRLAGMQPYLWTHIALGVEMGWQVLSPTGPFATAQAYNEKGLVKVLVLMTDGMQTAPGWGPDGLQTTAHAENNMQTMCAGMKARNINVFTIGYDLYDQRTLDLLRSCASSGAFYDTKDVHGGLVTSFKAISKKVRETMLRLSQ